MMPEPICAVCESPAPSKCSRCHSVYYCSPSHQKDHWKVHKGVCLAKDSPQDTGTPSTTTTTPSPDTLSVKELKEALKIRGVSTAGMTEKSDLVEALKAAPPPPPPPPSTKAATSPAPSYPGGVYPTHPSDGPRCGHKSDPDCVICAVAAPGFSFEPTTTACEACGVAGAGYKCGGCLKVLYCSPACQKGHLKCHAILCNEIIRTRSMNRSIMAGEEREGAESVLRAAVKRGRRELGDTHPQTFSSLASLASFLQEAGRLVEAEEAGREALASATAVLGPLHVDTLGWCGNLARTLSKMGKPREAEVVCRREWEGKAKVWGPMHHETLGALHTLAVIVSEFGDPRRTRESVGLHTRVQQGLLGSGGSGGSGGGGGGSGSAAAVPARATPTNLAALHPKARELYHTSRAALGGLFLQQGMFEEAEPMLRECGAVFTAANGPKHATSLSGAQNLGNCLVQMGKEEEGLPMLEGCLKGKRVVMGNRHPSTLNSMATLGNIYGVMGRGKEAEALYKEALEGMKATLPPSHPFLRNTAMGYAFFLESMGRGTEAEGIRRG